ncbi:MAG: DUF2344 domain-containing protein [Phycisphaerae bacterium]|nr:DUF2344 domain-containing protein [Phycisphaerae bacterium]
MQIEAESSRLMLHLFFKVYGQICYLSHLETLRCFERVCVRAGVPLRYSCGFNPRPRISLPLPRSVALESEAELACLRIETGYAPDLVEMKNSLQNEFPLGFKIIALNLSQSTKIPQAVGVKYEFNLNGDSFNEEIDSAILEVLGSESVFLQRRSKKGRIKEVDVRLYINSAIRAKRQITVDCKVTPAGTIRINELQQIFHLSSDRLDGQVKRKEVLWD